MKEIRVTDIEGIKIGNAQNFDAATGCTVILCEDGAAAGVDIRGGSPGTRETALLNPVNMIQEIHAVLLAGGSAFGLDAASGVMQYLEEKNIGFDVGVAKVPIVSGAVLFDLAIGSHTIRPDRTMGYEACINSELNAFSNGNYGAGTGATVGKILGPSFAMKGGLGSYAVQVGDLKIGAVVAANCLGDVIDPKTGEIIAGVLDSNRKTFASTEKIMVQKFDNKANLFNGNTTIGVVITNASLTKSEINKVASMAHNGYGRVIRPSHTMYDGDTIFSLATGKIPADVNVIGMLAANVMEMAVVNSIKAANSLLGFISYKDLLAEI
jgi:L-aminopeptidase/D-esterase-like protein